MSKFHGPEQGQIGKVKLNRTTSFPACCLSLNRVDIKTIWKGVKEACLSFVVLKHVAFLLPHSEYYSKHSLLAKIATFLQTRVAELQLNFVPTKGD